MEKQTRRITNWTSGAAAVAAFVTQPIPALDELIVVPIHYFLALRLAHARGFSVLQLPWVNIQKIIWYGAGARLVVNFSLGLVPFVGAFGNAATAIALTEYLGRFLDEAIANPNAAPPEITMEALKELFRKALQKMTDDKARAAAGGASKP
jgi:uncharacterized protein (DUF697 family)